jgi:hypothetical protein
MNWQLHRKRWIAPDTQLSNKFLYAWIALHREAFSLSIAPLHAVTVKHLNNLVHSRYEADTMRTEVFV